MNHRTLALKLVGFALVVLGAKLWLIGHYGVAVPLWDSWGQEGKKLYKPWLEGRFTAGMLFANNNVHHIVLTRLWDLTLFVLNAHRWDQRVQQVANALLHVAGSTFTLLVIHTRLGRLPGDLALGVMGACLVFPFAYVSTLWAYGSQSYFLIFLSVVTLWGCLGVTTESGTIPGGRFALRWWVGASAAFLACFTMGSGFLAAAVCTGVLLVWAMVTRQWRRAMPTLLVVGAATLLGLGLFARAFGETRGSTPVEIQPELVSALGTAGPGRYLHWLAGMGAVTGWPMSGGTQPWAGPLLYAPFGLWLWRRRRGGARLVPAPGEPVPGRKEGSGPADRWFFAGLGCWALTLAASIGLLRGVPPGARHLDMLGFGLLVNVIALGLLWRETSPGGARSRWLGATGTLLWSSLAGAGLLTAGRPVWERQLPAWKEQMPVFQQAVEHFLATDDPAYLQAHPAPFMDHPRWMGLSRLLRDPSIRGTLSGSLQAPGPEAARPRTWLDLILSSLVPAAVPGVILGGGLLLVAFWPTRPPATGGS